MSSQVLASEIDYWRQQLGDRGPVLQLPSDRPRTDTIPNELASYALVVPPAILAALDRLSQQTGITADVVLLTCLKILLFRYTNQEDLVVGWQTLGEEPGQTPPLNLLPIRTAVLPTASAKTVLTQVAALTQTALAQRLPSDRLISILDPQHQQGEGCPWQVNLVFTAAPTLDTSQNGAGLTRPHLKAQLGAAELTWHLFPSADGLQGSVLYNAYLFDRATIARMVGHFQTLLQGLVDDPEQPIAHLPMLTSTELQHILGDWKGAVADYAGRFVHRQFEAQVAQTPDATAVVFQAQHLTYQELNRRANQLARYLHQLGVRPEVRVGVCVTPCLDMVVGLMAILKAGGVYVPLDPTYPPERLGFLLEDSQTAVLLTHEALVASLPGYGGQVVCLDAQWHTIGDLEDSNLECAIASHNAAYLVYTSGTTGKPKGVIAEHRNLTNYILATCDRFQFDEHDVMPCIARFSFSISFFELLDPLVTGGTAMLFTRDHVLDINQFVGALERLTNIHTVPSLMRQIVDLIKAKNLDSDRYQKIKRIFIGGDIVPADLLEQMKAIFPQAQIYVFYGCSEATTLLLNYQVPKDARVEKRLVGKPFNNMWVRLYDKFQNLVPVGIAGEMYVGGAGVTRGYLNRPELVQEKYIEIEGERFYRTGDLARYLPDGTIEFIGRFDFQVKIGGVRIELGEIEAVLAQHPAVNKTVVTAWEDGSGEKKLVAYVVAEANQSVTTQALRSFMQGKLSASMLPSLFVFLDAFPLNPNGKIDRRALPAPDQVQRELTSELMTPRDDLECRLVALWEEILRVKPIGITDNFYDLGGNSLAAVQLFTRIATDLDKDVPVSTLFHAPTIAQLAEVLRTGSGGASWTSLVPIQPNGSKPPLYCIHAIGGSVFFYRDLVPYLAPDQPLYGFQAQGLTEKEPHPSIQTMAAAYIQEMRSLQPTGPYYLAGYSLGAIIAFEMARQLQVQGQQVGFLGLIENRAPGFRKPVSTARKVLRHAKNLLQQGYVYIQQKQAEKLRGQAVHTQQLEERSTLRSYQESGLPLPLDVRLINVRETALRALNTYQWQSYVGEATLFFAQDEPKSPGWDYEPLLGWGNYVLGKIEVFGIPGNHDSVVKEPNLKVLAETLSARLIAAQSKHA